MSAVLQKTLIGKTIIYFLLSELNKTSWVKRSVETSFKVKKASVHSFSHIHKLKKKNLGFRALTRIDEGLKIFVVHQTVLENTRINKRVEST